MFQTVMRDDHVKAPIRERQLMADGARFGAARISGQRLCIYVHARDIQFGELDRKAAGATAKIQDPVAFRKSVQPLIEQPHVGFTPASTRNRRSLIRAIGWPSSRSYSTS